MDRSSNLTRFYHARYEHALQAWKDGRQGEAEDICRVLAVEYACPPLIRVQAWQLRSRLTVVYYDARAYLEACFPIIDDVDMDEHDATVVDIRTYTQRMIDELDEIWIAQWKAKGEAPPTKEQLRKEEQDARELEEEEDQCLIDELAAYDLAKAAISNQMAEDPAKVPIAAAREETPPKFGPHLPGFVSASKWYESGIGHIPPLKVPPYTVEELHGLEDWARDETEQQREDMELAMKAAEQHMKELRLKKGDDGPIWPEAMEGVEEEKPAGVDPAPPSPAQSDESL